MMDFLFILVATFLTFLLLGIMLDTFLKWLNLKQEFREWFVRLFTKNKEK